MKYSLFFVTAIATVFGSLTPGQCQAMAQGREPLMVAQSPNQNLRSFFETGRPQSQDTLRFQRPPSSVPPIRPNANNWQLIVFSQGNVSFWMPPGILAQDSVVIGTSEGDLNFQTLTSTDDDHRYVAAYATGLTEQQINDPMALFTAMQARVAPTEMFSLMNERPVKLGDYQGSEFTFASDTERVIFRTYLVGDKIYAMGVIQPLNSTRDNAARTFLNALQFIDS
ncbi:hypothetical protein IQ218_12930 [Synechocystis salina LEGE 06099]|uniref:hypothetical protein n=1 Tax=Synechocystis salina TaxID=945780 RepID=UPI001881CD2F|nr:hypothetical protein [Synechocystis salina]MBE9204174.1 hypothetical protein [Synechocystis salina LEGE 06099]